MSWPADEENNRTMGAVEAETLELPAGHVGLVELIEHGVEVRTGIHVQDVTEAGLWINGGFFCFERGVLDYLREDSVLEREPFERLAADGQLRAYQHIGFWDCLDTYKDAVLLNDLWNSGRAPWKSWS